MVTLFLATILVFPSLALLLCILLRNIFVLWKYPMLRDLKPNLTWLHTLRTPFNTSGWVLLVFMIMKATNDFFVGISFFYQLIILSFIWSRCRPHFQKCTWFLWYLLLYILQERARIYLLCWTCATGFMLAAHL